MRCTIHEIRHDAFFSVECVQPAFLIPSMNFDIRVSEGTSLW
jgi:hypothetical protein